jgi:hypothetical protein
VAVPMPEAPEQAHGAEFRQRGENVLPGSGATPMRARAHVIEWSASASAPWRGPALLRIRRTGFMSHVRPQKAAIAALGQ